MEIFHVKQRKNMNDNDIIKNFYQKSLEYSDRMLIVERDKCKSAEEMYNSCQRRLDELYEACSALAEERDELKNKAENFVSAMKKFNEMPFYKKIFYTFVFDDE